MLNSFQKQTNDLIGPELDQVHQIINQHLFTNNPALADALQQMANRGGKFLRPTLLLLIAKAVVPQAWTPQMRDQLTKLAASIEILHMATLIHDDIIDDSPERRGQVSVQAKFGKDTAVYAGDLLFTQFFQLLIDTVTNQAFLQINAKAMRKILDGELGQMALRHQPNQRTLQYLRNIDGKTAALFKLATKEGAYFAGAYHRMSNYAAHFGQNLGLAFQIIDDLLDYSNGTRLNKPVMQDLATGVYSLPLLLALQKPAVAEKLQPLLADEINRHHEQAIRRIVIESGALDEARQLAQKFTQKAAWNLAKFPLTPARTLLESLTKELMQRTM